MSDFSYRVLIVVALVLFFAGVAYYNYSIIGNFIELNNLTTNGVLVKGKVVASNNAYSKSGEVYYLTYQYRPENLNVTITTQRKVNRSSYRLYSDIGDEIDILYDPKDPSISNVDGDESFVSGIVSILALDVLLICWSIWIYRY